jgi:two-component sensor histidine kinase
VASDDLRADHVLREFFEYRFGSVEERIDRMSDAFDKLSEAIISRAAFDELSHDVVRLEECATRNKNRVRDLEEQVRLGRYTVIGLLTVVGPLAVDKLRELFT